MTDHDKSLFQQAMAEMSDIKPIKNGNQYLEHQENAQQLKAQQRQVIRKLRQKQLQPKFNSDSFEKDHDIDSQPVGNFATLSYFQPGLRAQEIEKLKKGKYPNQAELDLHGLTVELAEKQIRDFLKQCYGYELRYIRIIHGKGYNSEDNFPVLKNLVNQILRQTPFILGFYSAPAKQGGSGAVNILLKAQ
ncbi:Smr/MutS family protein [Thiomicrorhabdus sediminis]|uniref:Smr domain-containing protein n=1 Tax=Thiomicrorhabdus sediminis TaxID=2580412 RepID=A0A4P9K5N0_9GAMM|nr:Smr/MutS family protein [Thiomicrorhabdus sediminis]QCU90168.1 hypothetical protein FE785_05765 [Thiomicrorhabdus sediminis]